MKLHEIRYPDSWGEKNSQSPIMHAANPILLCYRERPYLNSSETKLCPKASEVIAYIMTYITSVCVTDYC